MSKVYSPVLRCDGLTKRFSEAGRTLTILDDVALSVQSGEMLAILGASGSGKSTLLHLLGGLDTPTTGNVWIGDVDMYAQSARRRGMIRNQQLGFIYQFHHLLPEFNALENVCMPLLIRGDAPRAAQTRAAELIEKVGLQERMQHRVGELSGGERQRIAIARALVTEPMCVLADEPTGNLDNKTANKVFDLMLDLNKTLSTSFVVVTHDTALAKRMDRSLSLVNGKFQSQVGQSSQQASPVEIAAV